MWKWFRRPEPDRDRFERLEADMRALKRRMEEVDVEWSDWFGKFRRLYAAMAKRAKAEVEREEGPPEAQNGTLRLPNLGRPMNPLAAQLMQGPRSGG